MTVNTKWFLFSRVVTVHVSESETWTAKRHSGLYKFRTYCFRWHGLYSSWTDLRCYPGGIKQTEYLSLFALKLHIGSILTLNSSVMVVYKQTAVDSWKHSAPFQKKWVVKTGLESFYSTQCSSVWTSLMTTWEQDDVGRWSHSALWNIHYTADDT